MFSRWIVTNITSARGTLHCHKTRIPCGDQVVICGLYVSELRQPAGLLFVSQMVYEYGEPRWNDMDREIKLFQCYFFHHRSQMD
jgi:hypothetical protein